MKTHPIVSNNTCLSGHRLILARLGTMGLAGLSMVAFLLLLPAYLSYLHTVCVGATCPVGQLTPLAVQALQGMGTSISAFAVCVLLLTLLALLLCWGVAAVIVWRKSDDWMALLVALMLVLMGTSYVTHLILQQPSLWQMPALILNILAFEALFLVFSLFPNGRFVPYWIGWLPLGWIAWGLLVIFLHNIPGLYQLYLVGFLCELIGIVNAQFYRYRHISTSVQRQQTKWIVWGASVAMVGVVAVSLPEVLLPSLVQLSWLYRLLDAPVLLLALFLGALSIGMAILRSHLWDIDVLIQRTLVYGTLTASITSIYVTLLIALQFVLHRLFSNTNEVALIAATLAIAALFQPLRRRIQQGIDRRFYRRKYDAAQILETFGRRLSLRDDVELTTLTRDLLAVVKETMQPTHVSLWLLTPTPNEPYTTRKLE